MQIIGMAEINDIVGQQFVMRFDRGVAADLRGFGRRVDKRKVGDGGGVGGSLAHPYPQRFVTLDHLESWHRQRRNHRAVGIVDALSAARELSP